MGLLLPAKHRIESMTFIWIKSIHSNKQILMQKSIGKNMNLKCKS